MPTKLILRKDTEHARLSDAVYETLLEAILSGRMAPGTIVSEVALAKQLDVSRTPVHDALKQLAKDGLVDQQANHRAVIATFTPEDVRDIFEMRILLEGEAARRAATRLDRPTVARLRNTADALRKTRNKPGWLAMWVDFDDDFHDSIAKSTGSPRLWQDIARYRLFHRSFNKLATTVAVLQQALDEHCRILDALEKRDAKAAGQEMAAHIKEWQAYFVNHFPRAESK
jgi:DNA-binding GntR family transcriptional regulator